MTRYLRLLDTQKKSWNRDPRDARITIKVDASYLLGFRADPDAKCRSDNGDLWYECWRLIFSKNIRLNVVKISRSHATEEMVATESYRNATD